MLTFDRQDKRSLVQQISAMLTFDQQNSAMLTLVQQNSGMLTFDQQNSMVGSSDPKRKRKLDTMVLLPKTYSNPLAFK